MAFAVDLTGSILDRRYRITGLLGKGGMGHVYEAVHVALDQRVAVKVLHPRYAYEERFRERFLQEARAASKIKHPNVVEIKDFGDTPDGSVYFAMEYLHGHDVGDELERHGTLPWSRTRSILMQAASALHAAHAKHIVHRDIKPGNCFLIEDEAEGVVDLVKLLDFGIAKVGSDSHADAQGKGLTGTGEVFGTAAYMSPEQARGETLDARSDMYSLGIMAYQMLVGQVPFTGVNAIHVITQHLTAKPEPLRSHDGAIPPVVEALVLKMMAKERGDRFTSMAEVEAALREISAEVGARRTRLWSSPGELRGIIAEKKGAGAGGVVLPPGGESGVTSPAVAGVGVGSDPERTQKVAPKKEVAGAGGVKRTVVSVERAAVGVTPPVPMPTPVPVPVPASVEAASPAPALGVSVAAVPFGAPAAPITSPSPVAAGPSVQLGMQAPAGWGAPGRRDGTNPPPGVEDSSALPAVWSPGTASTGPHVRHGDTGTETHPHLLQASHAPGITARTLLVVGLLVVLVGAVSVLGTMAVLSNHEQAEAEGAAAASVGESSVKTEPSAPASSKVAEEQEVAEAVPVESEAPARSLAVVPGPERGELEESPRDAANASGDEGSQDEIVEDEIVEAEEAEEAPAAGGGGAEQAAVDERKDPQPAKLPKHETEKCTKARAAAHEALDQRRWAEAAKLSKQSECWSSAKQSDRRHIQVNALLESGRFADCVTAGSKATDAATVKMVDICRKRLPK